MAASLSHGKMPLVALPMAGFAICRGRERPGMGQDNLWGVAGSAFRFLVTKPSTGGFPLAGSESATAIIQNEMPSTGGFDCAHPPVEGGIISRGRIR